jgi:hypothetical protein
MRGTCPTLEPAWRPRRGHSHASHQRAAEPDADWTGGAGRRCSGATYQHGEAEADEASVGRPGDLTTHEQLISMAPGDFDGAKEELC